MNAADHFPNNITIYDKNYNYTVQVILYPLFLLLVVSCFAYGAMIFKLSVLSFQILIISFLFLSWKIRKNFRSLLLIASQMKDKELTTVRLTYKNAKLRGKYISLSVQGDDIELVVEQENGMTEKLKVPLEAIGLSRIKAKLLQNALETMDHKRLSVLQVALIEGGNPTKIKQKDGLSRLIANKHPSYVWVKLMTLPIIFIVSYYIGQQAFLP